MSLTHASHNITRQPSPFQDQTQVDVAQIVTDLSPLATTNYGSQVAYNYGTISNYFCQNDNALHRHGFPGSTTGNLQAEHEPLRRLAQARNLLSAGEYVQSKLLLEDLDVVEDTEPDPAQRAAIKFSLGYAHFSLAEYAEAASNYEAVAAWIDSREDIDTCEDIRSAPYWLGRCYFQLKNYTQAQAVLHAFIGSQQISPLCDTDDVINARLWLGMTLDCLGSNEAAREQLHRAWCLQDDANGPEHLQTLVNRHHLANLCFKQKSYNEAKGHFKWLLDVEERLTGPEKSQAVITRSMLAFTMCELGDIEAAVPHLQRALARIELQESHSTDEKRNLGLVRYWIGRDHFRQRQSDKARTMLNRALMTLTQEPELADKVLDCQLYMGASLVRLRESQAAEQILRNVLQTYRTRDRDGSDLIVNIYWLATSLILQRKFDEAQEVLDDVIITPDIIQDSRWTGSDIAACLCLRGEIYFKLRNWSAARICFGTLVDVNPAEPNMSFQSYRFWLGKTLYKLDEFEEARKHLQICFDLCRPGISTTSGCSFCTPWLAWTLAEVNDDSAEMYLRNTMQYFPSLPPNPTAWDKNLSGRTKYYLGRLLIKKNLSEATKLFREAVIMLESAFGDKEAIYLQCRYQLARCLLECREYDQALSILQEMQTIQHPSRFVQIICNTLVAFRISTVRIRLKKYVEARESLLQCLATWDEAATSEISLQLVKQDLAFCDLKLGNFEACIVELKPSIDAIDWETSDRRSINFHAVNYLTRALYFSYRYTEAAPLLDKYVTELRTLPGCAPNALLEFEAYLADSYCEMNEFDKARPLLISGALHNDASSGTSMGFCKAICKYWLGRLAFIDFKYTEAERYLVEAMRSLGNRKWLYSEKMRHSCRLYLANICLRRARLAEAEVMFTDLLQHPIKDYFSSTTADIQYLLGLTLKRQSQHARAKDMFLATLPIAHTAKQKPNMTQLCQYQLGMVLFDLGEFREAKQYFLQVVDYENSFTYKFDARQMAGNCSFNLEHFENARQIFEDLVRDGDQRSCCLANDKFLLGRTLHRLSQWAEAEGHLDHALENLRSDSSHMLECRFLAGEIAFKLKKTNRAIGLLSATKRACASGDEVIRVKTELLLARCYHDINDFQEASEGFSKLFEQAKLPISLDLELDYRIARVCHARCLRALGQFGRSRSELESVVEYFTSRFVQHDPTVIFVKSELADLAYMDCRFVEAAGLFKDALLDYQQIKTVVGFDIWQCRILFAHVLNKLDHLSHAVTIYRQVYRQKLAADIGSSGLVDDHLKLWRALRQDTKYIEALAFAQERLGLVEQQNIARSSTVLGAKIDLALAAFDLHRWQVVVDTASEVAVYVDEIAKMDLLPNKVSSEFLAKYSFALRMIHRHKEAKEIGLQAVNIGCRNHLIRSMNDSRYATAFIDCLGFDPAKFEADTPELACTSRKANEKGMSSNLEQITPNFKQDLAEIIAYGEIESRGQQLPASKSQLSIPQAITVDDTPQISPSSTPAVSPSPTKAKRPKPPKPPKSPALMDHLAVRLKAQSVQ